MCVCVCVCVVCVFKFICLYVCFLLQLLSFFCCHLCPHEYNSTVIVDVRVMRHHTIVLFQSEYGITAICTYFFLLLFSFSFFFDLL